MSALEVVEVLSPVLSAFILMVGSVLGAVIAHRQKSNGAVLQNVLNELQSFRSDITELYRRTDRNRDRIEAQPHATPPQYVGRGATITPHPRSGPAHRSTDRGSSHDRGDDRDVERRRRAGA